MTDIRPIENDRGTERAAPGIENARTFVRLRAETLLDSGSSREVLESHGINDENIVASWAQKHLQDAALVEETDRFLGSFDPDGALNGAIEIGPVTDEYLRPFESPLDLLVRRRTVKPEADSLAIFALLAEKRDEQLDIMTELLRHIANKNAIAPKDIYFGVPTDSPAHFVALEAHFQPLNKFTRRFGAPHTLLIRKAGSVSLDDMMQDINNE